ncbi:hypothetical protein CA13_49270 [Planctomycetes bacterium CA13]|uniref:Uncharacterized protein n=1 Tax=Novipirellula herctigrandis TaxID=2527986 RepID=A0A5C5Z839_9BACT|nr:hypothetical protein CA13_49270 [Planctomycetes bacterium CA13]
MLPVSRTKQVLSVPERWSQDGRLPGTHLDHEHKLRLPRSDNRLQPRSGQRESCELESGRKGILNAGHSLP